MLSSQQPLWMALINRLKCIQNHKQSKNLYKLKCDFAVITMSTDGLVPSMCWRHSHDQVQIFYIYRTGSWMVSVQSHLNGFNCLTFLTSASSCMGNGITKQSIPFHRNLLGKREQGVQSWALTKFPDFSLTFPWPFCGFPWPWDINYRHFITYLTLILQAIWQITHQK